MTTKPRTLHEAKAGVFRAFGPTPGRTQAVYDALDALIAVVRADAALLEVVPRLEDEENKDFSASLLRVDPSASPATAEALPNTGDAIKKLRDQLMIGIRSGNEWHHAVVDDLINAVRVEMLRYRHDCEDWAAEGIGCAHCNPIARELRLEHPELHRELDALQTGSGTDSSNAERALERTGAQRQDPTLASPTIPTREGTEPRLNEEDEILNAQQIICEAIERRSAEKEIQDSATRSGRDLSAPHPDAPREVRKEPCAFIDGRCTVCGEPESGMCNRPDGPCFAPPREACEGSCNAYEAPCGAKFCTYEEMHHHAKSCITKATDGNQASTEVSVSTVGALAHKSDSHIDPPPAPPRDVRDLLEDMLATIPGDDGRAFVQAYLDRLHDENDHNAALAAGDNGPCFESPREVRERIIEAKQALRDLAAVESVEEATLFDHRLDVLALTALQIARARIEKQYKHAYEGAEAIEDVCVADGMKHAFHAVDTLLNELADGNQAATQSSGNNRGSAAQKSSSTSSTNLLPPPTEE